MSTKIRVISLVVFLLVLSLSVVLTAVIPEVSNLLPNETAAKKLDVPNIMKKRVVPQYPFKVGEKLHYGIYSSGLKVGSSTITYLGFREINGQLTSFITIESKAPGFYDYEKIYGNIENSLPVRIERKVRIFGKETYIVEEYDQLRKEVLITRKSKNTETEIIKSENKINNIILLLYQFRYKKDYKIGDSMQFVLPTKKLEMVVDKETMIKVPEGSYSALYVRSIPSRFRVWFKHDNDRMPLRIQGAIGFGRTHLALLRVDQPN